VTAPFDHYADRYTDEVDQSISFIGQNHAFFTEVKADHLLRLARRVQGEPADIRALDVGCGIGETDSFLAGCFRELHGVDVAPAAVEVAARRNPSVSYKTYDGERLPYHQASFELVFAMCVMHHIPPQRWEAFAAELVRVALPGGLVVVVEHNPYNPLTRLAVARCSFDKDAVLIERKRMRVLFDAIGLEISEQRYFLFFPWRLPGSSKAEIALKWLPTGAQYLLAGRKAIPGHGPATKLA
jgi:SAM-dependent methyltransferase